jgi:hypothetical protein
MPTPKMLPPITSTDGLELRDRNSSTNWLYRSRAFPLELIVATIDTTNDRSLEGGVKYVFLPSEESLIENVLQRSLIRTGIPSIMGYPAPHFCMLIGSKRWLYV